MHDKAPNGLELGIVAFRSIILSEITGLRRLVILTATIGICLTLMSLATNAYRIYTVEKRLSPLRAEVETLYKELNYECRNPGIDKAVQCRLRQARKRQLDESNGQ